MTCIKNRLLAGAKRGGKATSGVVHIRGERGEWCLQQSKSNGGALYLFNTCNGNKQWVTNTAFKLLNTQDDKDIKGDKEDDKDVKGDKEDEKEVKHKVCCGCGKVIHDHQMSVWGWYHRGCLNE